ncbi:MAG: hypothetical protein JWM20_79 [Patescibacteria group bacterium]|nr:hypothetical protein [Patescibacteria group bacterium]
MAGFRSLFSSGDRFKIVREDISLVHLSDSKEDLEKFKIIIEANAELGIDQNIIF